jgi:hypothetical protein
MPYTRLFLPLHSCNFGLKSIVCLGYVHIRRGPRAVNRIRDGRVGGRCRGRPRYSYNARSAGVLEGTWHPTCKWGVGKTILNTRGYCSWRVAAFHAAHPRRQSLYLDHLRRQSSYLDLVDVSVPIISIHDYVMKAWWTFWTCVRPSIVPGR